MSTFSGTSAPAGSLGRRRIVQGAAWSVPVIVMGSAAPALAVSPPCVATIDWTNATFLRTDYLNATFTWTNLFGAGKNLVLAVTATGVNVNAVPNTTSNLTYTGGTVSGQPDGGLDLSLDNLADSAGLTGEDVAFAFTYGGSPITVTNLSFMIGDIDGAYHVSGANADNKAAEWVSINAGTGVIQDTAYVGGAGTVADPWIRRNPSNPDTNGIATSATTGSVAIANPSTSGFTVRFRLDSGALGNYNLWITPFQFTIKNPACA
jgi:hypothetical protein